MGKPYRLRDGTLGPFGLAMVAESGWKKHGIFRCGAAVWVTTVPDIGLLSFSRTSGILAAVAGGKESWLQGKSN